jgi:hypothetical protein
MLHELVEPGDQTPDELHERYLDALGNVLDDHDIDKALEATDLDQETLERLADGAPVELTLEEAASVLGLDADAPDADTIETLARDELLMGMMTAVLDVEAVESGIDGELEAREIQSKVEGRYPMTLREFALLYQFIDGKR